MPESFRRQPATLLKKRLWHKCFPMKNTIFTEHLRVTSSESKETSGMKWIKNL